MGLNTKKQDTGPAVEGLQVPKALSTTGTPSGNKCCPTSRCRGHNSWLTQSYI